MVPSSNVKLIVGKENADMKSRYDELLIFLHLQDD